MALISKAESRYGGSCKLGTPEVYTGKERNFGYLFYQYPNGSYFSKTGKACTCHSSTSNPCSWNKSCDCINFENAIQCMAFAKKVYYEVHGSSVPSLTPKNMSLTAESAKKLFNHNNTSPEATYLEVKTNSNARHFIVIVLSNENKVTIYHANYGGLCLVRYESYTWENFVKAFPYLTAYTN